MDGWMLFCGVEWEEWQSEMGGDLSLDQDFRVIVLVIRFPGDGDLEGYDVYPIGGIQDNCCLS